MVMHIVKFHGIKEVYFSDLNGSNSDILFEISRQDTTLYKTVKHNEGRFPNMKHNFDYTTGYHYFITHQKSDKLTSYLSPAS